MTNLNRIDPQNLKFLNGSQLCQTTCLECCVIHPFDPFVFNESDFVTGETTERPLSLRHHVLTGQVPNMTRKVIFRYKRWQIPKAALTKPLLQIFYFRKTLNNHLYAPINHCKLEESCFRHRPIPTCQSLGQIERETI